MTLPFNVKRRTVVAGAVACATGVGAGRLLRRWRAPTDSFGLTFDRRPTAAPDPNRSYVIPVTDEPLVGRPDAAIQFVTFMDFTCPICAAAYVRLAPVIHSAPPDVVLQWHDLPLPSHRHALDAALVGREAARQKRFWPYVDRMLADPARRVDVAVVRESAAAVGLSDREVDRALRDREALAAIQSDVDLAHRLGLRGTPSSFLNGRYHPGQAGPIALEQALRGRDEPACRSEG